MRVPNMLSCIAVVAAVVLCNPGAAQGGVLWQQASPVHRPGPRFGHAMVFDAVHERVVLFGGSSGGDETWLWDGVDWQEVAVPPAQRPPARSGHGMAYDSARARVVMFGGVGLDDTWEWDGSSWLLQNPVQRPPVGGGAMAFHAVTGRSVLLHWSGSTTWQWDGSSWSQHLGAGPLFSGGLAYDDARQRTVAFDPLMCETWEWDGTAWAVVHAATCLPDRYQLAFHAHRQRVVLYGGYDGAISYNDVWEWDGATWANRGSGPWPERSNHALAYDAVRRQVVLFGGEFMDCCNAPYYQVLDDTHVMASASPAGFSSYGAGCSGGATPLELAPAAHSLPWAGDTFAIELSGVVPGSVPFLVVGFDRVQIDLGWLGLPGCTQWVRADFGFLLSPGGATASWSVSLPSAPALVGLAIDMQGIALNAGASNVLGAVVSNAGEAVVGVR